MSGEQISILSPNILKNLLTREYLPVILAGLSSIHWQGKPMNNLLFTIVTDEVVSIATGALLSSGLQLTRLRS